MEAQKQDIREQARKRDEYVNYQQDMDATLQRNEQVYSEGNYKIAILQGRKSVCESLNEIFF